MTPSTPTTPSLPREVTLARDSSGSLGLSIAGGRGSALGDVPITVASLTSHGPAMLCGEIKVRCVLDVVWQLAAAFSRPSSVLQLCCHLLSRQVLCNQLLVTLVIKHNIATVTGHSIDR